MTRKRHGEQLGTSLIVAHFVVIGLTIFVFATGPFEARDLKATFAVITPTLAAFGMAAMIYFTKHHEKVEDTSPEISGPFQFLSWFVSAVLILSLIAAVLAQNQRKFAIEDYVLMLGIIETGFGAYVAQVVKTLFES